MKHSYNKNELEELIRTSKSYAQVLRKMNITPAGGNYHTLKNKIKEYKISTDHFTGMGWNVGLKFKPTKPLPIEEFLKKDRPCSSHHLKSRLIKEGLKEWRCEQCLNTEWLNKPIPIELEHSDGDHNNNELSNLKILCPNCHAQTSHYRGRASRSSTKYARMRKQVDPNLCIDCLKIISSSAKRCKSCTGKKQPTKINWPSNEELLIMIKKSNYTAVAKELGVSDNALRKRIKNH